MITKTTRIIELIFLLLKKKEGISKKDVMFKYKICEKTFIRDIIFLKQLDCIEFFYDEKNEELFLK